jgi:1-acyl-sn-glycerol-3-phosphate acyltransferase
MKQLTGKILQIVFAVQFSLVFVPLSILLFLLLLLPNLKWRRSAARSLSKFGLFLCGIPVTAIGMENLPSGACVVVANHASYLDGIILTAVLPPDYAFVIKREVTGVPFIHFLLRRIGSEFVERKETEGKARDSRRLLRKASSGSSMVFFPEGTFRRKPELLPFHNGAFAVAVRGGLPVVPVVIHGTRHILLAEALLPRWGKIAVDILPPVGPAKPGPEGQNWLKESARQRILSGLDQLQPDPT